MTTLEGGCHCGTIAVKLETPSSVGAITPRMCGCGFCRKHPAKWFADSHGRLTLSFTAEPTRYRFGTKTADFLLCAQCGVIVAAICKVEDAAYGIVNLNCFERPGGWQEPDALSDFDGEGTGDRLARRARNWMPVTLPNVWSTDGGHPLSSWGSSDGMESTRSGEGSKRPGMTAGYSGTPLAKKLSLRDGQRVWFDGMPESVQDEIGEYALELTFVGGPEEGPDAAHLFVTERAYLAAKLAVLKEHMARDGHVWVSWPKRASKVPTDITEDTIRDVALPMGLVDTKVCAVDEVWSGLKLVIRKELR